jgi:Zn-dependent alcohol dehydrogenase
MRAAVSRAIGHIEVEDIDDPAPRAGEVKIRIAAVGVCHTDLSMLHGHLPAQFPIVLGHEGAGVVVEVGPGVQELAVGDHVVCSIIAFCGHCWYCARGEFPLCTGTVFFTGKMLDGTTRLAKGGEPIHTLHFQGSFAEYAVVPERFAVKVRADAPLDKICGFACGVSTGMGAAMVRAEVTPGSSVLVVGAGGVGTSAMIGARVMGATTIIAADIADKKITNALANGFATHGVNSSTSGLLATVRELTDGRGVDFAFDAVGMPGTLETAVDATRQGGTCVVIGRGDATITASVMTSQFLRHKTVTGTFGGSITPKRHIPEFVDLYMQGRLDLDRLLDARYGLDDIATALDDLHHGRMTRGVVVID